MEPVTPTSAPHHRRNSKQNVGDDHDRDTFRVWLRKYGDSRNCFCFGRSICIIVRPHRTCSQTSARTIGNLILQSHMHCDGAFGSSISLGSPVGGSETVAKFDSLRGPPAIRPIICDCSTNFPKSRISASHRHHHATIRRMMDWRRPRRRSHGRGPSRRRRGQTRGPVPCSRSRGVRRPKVMNACGVTSQFANLLTLVSLSVIFDLN